MMLLGLLRMTLAGKGHARVTQASRACPGCRSPFYRGRAPSTTPSRMETGPTLPPFRRSAFHSGRACRQACPVWKRDLPCLTASTWREELSLCRSPFYRGRAPSTTPSRMETGPTLPPFRRSAFHSGRACRQACPVWKRDLLAAGDRVTLLVHCFIIPSATGLEAIAHDLP